MFIDEDGILHDKIGDKIDSDGWDHYKNKMFNATEFDPSMFRIAAMNLMLHGIENPQITQVDALSSQYDEEDKYSLVLANPPFKGSIDEGDINKSLRSVVKTKKTELLFLALIDRILDMGGRGAVIVPDGVLFGSSKAHKDLRKKIVDECELRAVISMPSGVFRPYTGVSTGILIFTKGGQTDKVWFYDMEADGYSLDDKRNEVEANDIPNIIESFRKCMEDKSLEPHKEDKWFFVDKKDIVDNGYDLSITKYKEIEYEGVVYEAPSAIMDKIEKLEMGILEDIKVLKKMVNGHE